MTRLLLLALPVALLACGGDAEPLPTDAPASASTAVPTSTASDAPVAPEPDSAEAFVLPSLTPATMDYETPIPVQDLRDVVAAPYGKTVAVYGYVQDAPSSVTGKVQIGQTVALAAEPGQGDREAGLVTCRLAERPEANRVEPDAVLVLRGEVSAPNSGKMRLRDGCEIVSVGEGAPDGAISAQDLHGAMFGWVGTGVSVVGRYNGTTTSQLPSGERVTVGLAPPGDERGPQAVVCVMAEAVPEMASEDRGHVVLTGVVTEEWTLSLRSVDRSVIELADCHFSGR